MINLDTRMVVSIITDAAPQHCWPTDINVENPQRVASIEAALAADGLHCSPPPPLHPSTHDAITAVHTSDYVHFLQHTCAGLPDGQAEVVADPEVAAEYTYVTRHSYDAAVRAVSACLHAADTVATGGGAAFVAVRPPGHHALPSQASGFCLLSNVAIMVGHLQHAHRVQRVAIVDVDVHHGNGTQAAFYSNPDVLFVDIHEAGVWPGSGGAEETGEGAGVGATCNIPLPVGAGDEALREAWASQVEPLLTTFQPSVIVASAGFDAHADDPLGKLQYSDAAYRFLGSALAGGRLVAVLEGGYDRGALGRASVQFVRGMEE